MCRLNRLKIGLRSSGRVAANGIGINAVAVNDMSNDSMSWLAPVEMWTKSRLGYQQLPFIPFYVSGVATLAGVENKERRYHTRCKEANRTSRLVATLVHNFPIICVRWGF